MRKLASLLATADQRRLGAYDAAKELITESWERPQRETVAKMVGAPCGGAVPLTSGLCPL
jgi:hypothetical protein